MGIADSFLEASRLEEATNKTELKINFVDFWNGFKPRDNMFVRILRTRYKLTISDKPDVVFCSCFGKGFKKYKCKRILFIGENVTPNFNAYDYAMAFDFIDFQDRYMRLPLYYYHMDMLQGHKGLVVGDVDPLRRKFCNIVVSNYMHTDGARTLFFDRLSEYRRVDSGGKAFNNVGGSVSDKRKFCRQYKFTIAFENSSYPGYVTEKIIDAFLSRSVPIYYGSMDVGMDFDEGSFINVHRFKSMDEAVDFIKHLDKNDEEYLRMLEHNPLMDNVFAGGLTHKRVLDFLVHAIEHGRIYHKDSLPLRDPNGNYKSYPLYVRYLTMLIPTKRLRRRAREYIMRRIIEAKCKDIHTLQ